MEWSRVIALSLAAHGPVTIASAARACGGTRRSVARRADREGWGRPFPQIIVPPGIPMDGWSWARAATLHVAGDDDTRGASVAVTRSSALALYGLARTFPTTTEIAVPADRVVRARPRLAVVRSRLLRADEVTSVDGVPVLRGAPLLRDLAPVRNRAALRSTIIDLSQGGYVEVEALPTFPQQQSPFPGKAVLREAVADLVGAGRTDSSFEWEVRHRLTEEGIPLDRGQVPVPGSHGMHLDLGIAAIRFGIELQSVAFHTSRQQLDRDVARANVIAGLDGWRVLYATWTVLDRGWDDFLAQVRDVISSQARRHLGVPWPPVTALVP